MVVQLVLLTQLSYSHSDGHVHLYCNTYEHYEPRVPRPAGSTNYPGRSSTRWTFWGPQVRRFITLLYYMSYASDTDKGEPFSALYGHTGHRLDALDMVYGYTLHVIEYMRHLYLTILSERN